MKAHRLSLAGKGVVSLESRRRAVRVWNELQEQGEEKRGEEKQIIETS